MVLNGAEKLIYLTLGILFLVLGLIGLIIPILPGVLFLAGALYMLSRGSQRVKTLSEQNPTLRRVQARMDQFDGVSALEKVQVACLAMVQAAAVGARKIYVGVTGLVR